MQNRGSRQGFPQGHVSPPPSPLPRLTSSSFLIPSSLWLFSPLSPPSSLLSPLLSHTLSSLFCPSSLISPFLFTLPPPSSPLSLSTLTLLLQDSTVRHRDVCTPWLYCGAGATVVPPLLPYPLWCLPSPLPLWWLPSPLPSMVAPLLPSSLQSLRSSPTLYRASLLPLPTMAPPPPSLPSPCLPALPPSLLSPLLPSPLPSLSLPQPDNLNCLLAYLSGWLFAPVSSPVLLLFCLSWLPPCVLAVLCLFVCLSVSLVVCLSVCLLPCLSVYSSVCLVFYLSLIICVLFIRLFIYS